MDSDSSKRKVAVIQTTPVFLNKAATIEKACDLIAEAGRWGAELALLPEAFVSGYPDWVWLLPPSKKDQISELYRRLLESSITVGDEATQQLCKAAKTAGVVVAVGINERNAEASGQSLFNSLLYIGSDGKILGCHRKLIPTGGERLMWSQGSADSLHSFDTSIGRIGGLICWENYMPLARNVMYRAGVQIYLAPTWDSSESWQIAMRHIAREGGVFVLNCAPCMRLADIPDECEFKTLYADGREWINRGNSCVVGPDGKYLVEPVSEQQTIIYAELDLSLIPSQKWLFDVAGHYSRPELPDSSSSTD